MARIDASPASTVKGARSIRGETVNTAAPFSSSAVGLPAATSITTALFASSVTCASPNETLDGAAPATTRDGPSLATCGAGGPFIEKKASANAAAAAAG